MYKPSWMDKDLIATLDLEGLVLETPESYEDADNTRAEIVTNIELIDAYLVYAKFVEENFEGISTNINILTDISFSLSDLYNEWRYVIDKIDDDKLKSTVQAYFDFFNAPLGANNIITLRGKKIDLPEEPFTRVLSWAVNRKQSTLSSNQVKTFESIEVLANNGVKVASDVANSVEKMVEYDISKAVSDFDESKIGAWNKIFDGVNPSFEISDIESLEDALTDVKAQLECIEQILSGQ